MPTLGSVIDDEWAQMPDSVLQCTLLTTRSTKLPPLSVRKGFLLRFLTKAGLSVTQRQLGGERVSEGLADNVRQVLRDPARQQDLSIIAAWGTFLRQTLSTHQLKSKEALALASQLAAEFGNHKDLDIATQTQLLQEAVETTAELQSKNHNLTSAMLRSYIEDEVNRKQCEQVLDKIWQQRVSAADEPTKHLVDGLFFKILNIGNSPSLEEGSIYEEELWQKSLSLELESHDRLASKFQLTRNPLLQRPSLLELPSSRVGAPVPEGNGQETAARAPNLAEERFPLDQTIKDRLVRTRYGGGSLAIRVPLSPAEAFELAILGSARPLGLPFSWADRVICLGIAATSVLTYDPRKKNSLARTLSGRTYKLARKWVIAVNSQAKPQRGAESLDQGCAPEDRLTHHWRGQANSEEATSFYQDPMQYIIGRLWTRVLRCCLISQSPPSLEEAWDEITGACNSACEDIPRIIGEQVKRRGYQSELRDELAYPSPAAIKLEESHFPNNFIAFEKVLSSLSEKSNIEISQYCAEVLNPEDSNHTEALTQQWQQQADSIYSKQLATDGSHSSLTPQFEDFRQWLLGVQGGILSDSKPALQENARQTTESYQVRLDQRS